MSIAIKCPVCEDTGWLPAGPGAGVRPCECRKPTAAAAYRITGIPAKYLDCSLGNFDADWEGARNPSLWTALNVAGKYADDYTPGDPKAKGLLFQGLPGTGKTHLLVALLKTFCERGIECLFLDYQELLRQIQQSYNKESQTTEYELLQPVLSTEIVAIDDLGNNRISDWVEDTVTYVVNHRYSQNRPTLFTANLHDVTRPTFTERLGPRVASRLREMCRFVELQSGDYRARGR